MLRALDGLTKTEADLAAALSRGASLRDCCACHAVTINTAKTHLRRILEKTDTRRQAQLVGLLCKLQVVDPVMGEAGQADQRSDEAARAGPLAIAPAVPSPLLCHAGQLPE